MSRRKAKQPAAQPDETIVQLQALGMTASASALSIAAANELPFLIDRAPKSEPGRVRQGLDYALWELDSSRGKGRAVGSRAARQQETLATQLMLGETVPSVMDEDEGLLGKIGSDMTLAQRKAVFALSIMLHDRRYQPDDSDEIHVGSRTFSSNIIVCTVGEYLEAYGLEKAAGSGRISSAQRDEAIEALLMLGRQSRHISLPIEHVDDTQQGKGKKRARISRSRLEMDGPLIQVSRLYTELSEREQKREASPDNRRLTRLMISMHPLITYDLSKRFFLQPRDHYRQLAAAYQLVSGKSLRKLPVSIDRFTRWLRTIGYKMADWDEEKRPSYTISREKLAEKILPENMLAQRRKSEQDAAILLAIDVAIELGLLLGWEPAMSGTGYTFWLNPEECSRLGQHAIELKNRN